MMLKPSARGVGWQRQPTSLSVFSALPLAETSRACAPASALAHAVEDDEGGGGVERNCVGCGVFVPAQIEVIARRFFRQAHRPRSRRPG